MQNESFANILIVDDKPENLLVLEGLLESMDCNIMKASSGNEALSMLLDYNFALILLDVQMPEMDGFETAELMRGSERTKFIPIIFVTAISKEQKCIFKGYQSGAVDYLFKPIDPIILQSKVQVFIHMYNQKKIVEEQSELLLLKINELTELKETNNRLEKMSLSDGLTGIPNRRSFDIYLNTSWKNVIRSQKPISMIMVDIDYFKHYNDCYGHLKGDDCLVLVANAMDLSILRPLDYVARYGGEEFAVILPETDEEGALFVAETIRMNIENLKISHEKSKVSEYVTISLGVASILPNQEERIENFIDMSDKALYQAKLSGRNKVCLYK